MTVKQKQHLLAYLGYYEGDIDGIWGPESQAATKKFQAACHMTVVDGIFGPDTQKGILEVIYTGKQPDTFWTEIRYFGRGEFACRCGKCGGFPAEPKEKLIRTADRVRTHFESPMTVSSGVRCASRNEAVGGVRNSRHLTGKAMDFCVLGKTAPEVLSFVRKQPEIRYAYAIDDRFVHMDIA